MLKNNAKILIFTASFCLFFVGIFFLNKKLYNPRALSTQSSVATNSGTNNSENNLDLAISHQDTPDLVIVSKTFANLWKDLLKVPLLKTLISEELLYYYEEAESFLSLKGALKRLVFEHETTLFDDLFFAFLNRPIQLAYWKSYNGRLNYFFGSIKRTFATEILATLSKVALSDNQFSILRKEVVDGVEVDLYQLSYSPRNSIYFYWTKNELVFFNNLLIKLPDSELTKKMFRLSNLGLGNSNEKKSNPTHELIVNGEFLTFGYNSFLKGLDFIKLEFQNEKWKTFLKDDSNSNEKMVSALDEAISHHPSFCTFLKLDLEKISTFLTLDRKITEKISDSLSLCWYDSSTIYTPILALQLKAPLDFESAKTVFAQFVGSFEKGILTPEESEKRKMQIAQINNGEEVSDLVRATKFLPPFELVTEMDGSNWKISREISSKYGIYPGSNSKNSKNMRSSRFYKVTFASQNNHYLFFSADDKLVTNAVATLKKTYPSLLEKISSKTSLTHTGEKSPSVYFDPPSVGALIKKTIQDSLPEKEESFFRERVAEHLFPLLEKWKNEKVFLGEITTSNKIKSPWNEVQWLDL